MVSAWSLWPGLPNMVSTEGSEMSFSSLGPFLAPFLLAEFKVLAVE